MNFARNRGMAAFFFLFAVPFICAFNVNLHSSHTSLVGASIAPRPLNIVLRISDESSSPPEASKLIPEEKEKKGILRKLKTLVLGDSKLDKEKLKSLGASALLSYGWVSNASYMICLSLAWFVHSKRTGLSPLAAGQKPQFLAVYTGFFVFQNIIRPLRFALSLFLTPVFDKLVAFIMKKTGLSKPKAFGVAVFLVNICGTFTLMFSGITVASMASGVPIFPPRAPVVF
mmetsp:Transcript_28113/g.36507  ORF Transcript_28113/g.36507 Transcript_28113/m.36507 type:complete len:229 (+) Transcript_28113:51-737(+)